MMKTAVVTALWYEDKFLPALFESLEKTNYPLADWEIIMIDNKNSERTRDWIEKNVRPKVGISLPAFKLIKTEANLGFSGGNNACIKLAIEHGCEAVYLLNEDARGEPDFLMNAINRLAFDPDLGAVQSFLVLDEASSQGVASRVNSIGNRFHFLGFSYCGGYKMPRHDAVGFLRVRALRDPRLLISAASGAAVLFRVDALKTVGLLDEGYHLYHEDLDLSLRLREAGYDITIEPSSVVHHHYEFSRSVDKYYWMERNRYRLLLEHFRPATLIVLLPGLIVSEFGLVVFSVMNRTLGARLKAYGYILNPRHWPEIWRKRQRVQELRRIGDRELLARAVSSISFQETSSLAMKIINPLMGAYWFLAKRVIYW